MSVEKLTVAVIGAGGKMGRRVSANLQKSAHTVFEPRPTEGVRRCGDCWSTLWPLLRPARPAKRCGQFILPWKGHLILGGQPAA